LAASKARLEIQGQQARKVPRVRQARLERLA
jgi:hypothetical protein